jgi:DNA repair exonuclease SbcCD ATPase subunit
LNTFGKHHLRHAAEKASTTGAGTLQPLDPNQDVLSLREAQSQKRKATSPTPPEDDLDQEIQNLEMLQQHVQRKKEKMARLADLQRQIDEASEEVRHLVQDDQSRRPQRRELHQEAFYNEEDWYEDFHHGNFAFDDASPLSIEL